MENCYFLKYANELRKIWAKISGISLNWWWFYERVFWWSKWNYGIYFENDRNVILSIDKFKDYEAETIVKLLGNPIETTDLVGLVSDVTNYGKDNSFESCYSLNGYIFGLNRKYIYVVLSRFNHSKILFKHKIDNCKNEFKLKIKKYNSIVKFYLDDKEIYKTISSISLYKIAASSDIPI